MYIYAGAHIFDCKRFPKCIYMLKYIIIYMMVHHCKFVFRLGLFLVRTLFVLNWGKQTQRMRRLHAPVPLCVVQPTTGSNRKQMGRNRLSLYKGLQHPHLCVVSQTRNGPNAAEALSYYTLYNSPVPHTFCFGSK